MNTIFDLCVPRKDVLSGHLTESDFAADLAQVIDKRAPVEYQNSDVFFANTHPTKGLKYLLKKRRGSQAVAHEVPKWSS